MPALRAQDVPERYLSYLDMGRSALADALGMLGDPEEYPLVFHCQAGKDRTGILAALVLDCIGVEREVIVEDYVLTAGRMDLIIGRLRRDPVYAEHIDDLPASVFAVEAATMEAFLRGLDQRHGGGRAWALGAGVRPDVLDAMTDLLVEA